LTLLEGLVRYRYFRADIAWQRAFDAAERVGEASLKERLAQPYGWSTPAAREAEGPPPEDVRIVDSMAALRKIDFDEALERLGLQRDDGFG